MLHFDFVTKTNTMGPIHFTDDLKIIFRQLVNSQNIYDNLTTDLKTKSHDHM